MPFWVCPNASPCGPHNIVIVGDQVRHSLSPEEVTTDWPPICNYRVSFSLLASYSDLMKLEFEGEADPATKIHFAVGDRLSNARGESLTDNIVGSELMVAFPNSIFITVEKPTPSLTLKASFID